MGKFDEALELYYREALEGRRSVLGAEHRDTLTSISSLGNILQAQGKLAEAELYYREALEGRRSVLGDKHQDTLRSIKKMGYILEAHGKLAEAERYYREELEGRRSVLGDEHPDTLKLINSTGVRLQEQGEFDEAESLFAEGTHAAQSALGDHPLTATLEHHHADVLRELGRLDEAIDLAQTAFARYQAHPDWSPREAAHTQAVLGASLRAAGREAEALAVLWEWIQLERQRPGMPPARMASTLAKFAQEAIVAGDRASLERAERAVRECLEIRENACCRTTILRFWLQVHRDEPAGRRARPANVGALARAWRLRD